MGHDTTAMLAMEVVLQGEAFVEVVSTEVASAAGIWGTEAVPMGEAKMETLVANEGMDLMAEVAVVVMVMA